MTERISEASALLKARIAGTLYLAIMQWQPPHKHPQFRCNLL
jgi:hypothetical protein